MSLFEQLNPNGALQLENPCRARNENIEAASCDVVAFGTGAHLCIRPKGHKDGPVEPYALGAVARFYRDLADDHICECGVRWK